MVREILKYPDPFLKTVADPVAEVTDEVRALIEDMIETMYAGRGVGLAATQIGVGKRVMVLDIPEETEEGEEPRSHLIALVNPEIVEAEGQTTFEEGCLSFPGLTADVKRAECVKLKALDRDGKPVEIETDGLFAIVLQHEIDHLDGILFIDRLGRIKRDILKRKYRKLRQEQEAEAV